MKYEPEKYHRRSTRLKSYDYSQEGGYFVTICTQNRKCLLGKVVGGNMELSSIGKIAQEYLFDISKHFVNVKLDQFVIMPNHVHSIILICRGEVTSPLQKSTLGQVVAYYKYQTTKLINQLRRTPSIRVWQRNYYEHIIRSEKELDNIQEYITNNPLKWELDRENPDSANYNLEHKKYFEGIYE